MNTLERTIVTALLRDMRIAGYRPAAIWDGCEYVLGGEAGELLNVASDDAIVDCGIARELTDAEVLEQIADIDDFPTLHFTHLNKSTWGNRGVMLITGNGEDIISDYHVVAGEPFGAVIERLYDCLSNGATL